MIILKLVVCCIAIIECNGYQYIDLSLKWCPSDNVGKWSINGFFPNWCDKSKYTSFNNSVIEEIRPMLAEYWGICNNRYRNTDYELWKHEWEKHGSCAGNTIVKYFSHALNAFFLASQNNWYGCCDKSLHPLTTLSLPLTSYLQCLIPFYKNDTEIRWLGYCHSTTVIFE